MDVAALEAALTHWAEVVADALPLPSPRDEIDQ